MKRKYDNAEELQRKIDDYFEECLFEKVKPGFAGLAYYLGFSERRSLNDYAARGDALSTPIKRAMLRIESIYEQQLHKQSCTGAIFALKNRGWKDSQEIDVKGNLNVKNTFQFVETDDNTDTEQA